MTYNLWPIFFLPIGLAMSCCININMEKRCGHYKGLLSNNLPESKIWYSKIISIVIYQCISSLLVIIVATLGSLIINKEFPNIPQLIFTTIFITIASLPLIPLCLILCQYVGVIITILLSLVGSFGSVFIALKSYFWILPWGNMMRVSAETMGINPNGTPMDNFNKIPDFYVLAIIILVSIVYFIVLSMLSMLVFKRKGLYEVL
ncbi:lantibiotic immunity ABC transporter MutE/EpiE family permease subunit [Scopulibacillus daqui]|uniref:lantibiotic immunity ABC transporter MutE/EpiE family permease subunit n=1 Tax=Scopulibacillus daqui TaxID=1469162 RepID=UPI0035EE039E